MLGRESKRVEAGLGSSTATGTSSCGAEAATGVSSLTTMYSTLQSLLFSHEAAAGATDSMTAAGSATTGSAATGLQGRALRIQQTLWPARQRRWAQLLE